MIDNFSQAITQIEAGIIKALAYYDIFDYPLTEKELRAVIPVSLEEDQHLEAQLKRLVSLGMIHRVGSYHMIKPRPSLVDRRLKGNNLAQKKLGLAIRIGKFIGSFPFITTVMLSGSISKGYMDKNSDIDFFLITKPGRLWVARTILVLFKRLFLFNSHKYFCVNYFVDSDHLEIEDQNIFTATEIVTLIPAYNPNGHIEFLRANQWVKDYFPNSHLTEAHGNINGQRRPVKEMFQLLLSNPVGDWLDRYFQRMTLKRWTRKFQDQFNDEDFERAFRSRKYVSKNHERDFQKVVTTRYLKKINEFEKAHSTVLE